MASTAAWQRPRTRRAPRPSSCRRWPGGGSDRAFTPLLDNLPGNGRVLRAAVLAMAQRLDPGLADWIAREVRFPCSMVDRIVPATTPELIGQVEAATGMRDEAVVAHEPFFQWVLEDIWARVRGRR